MDCIRIFLKINELKDNLEADPVLWLPEHLSIVDLRDMTAKIGVQTPKVVSLMRGETYERSRGEDSQKADI